jgi:DNA replication protein DnaC
MNKPALIKIIGYTGTGKSTLAWAIKNMLNKNGIKCNIAGCEDEIPGVMDTSWKKRMDSLKGKTIEIETIQAIRSSL